MTMETRDPGAVVRAFLLSWTKPREHIFDTFPDLLSENVVWINVGLSRAEGRDNLISCFKNQGQVYRNCARIEVDVRHLVVTGNVVLVERVDRLFDEAGALLSVFEAMGSFDVRNGRITEWRDYFNVIPFRDWAIKEGYIDPFAKRDGAYTTYERCRLSSQ